MKRRMLALSIGVSLMQASCSAVDDYTHDSEPSWCLLRGESSGLNLYGFVHLFEAKRRAKEYLFNRWNMYLNKLCESIIGLSISIFFKDNDMIRFMGEYVHAKKTLKQVWFNDIKELDGPFDKLWFAITRVKEARYFKFKKTPVSNTGRPSRRWIVRRFI